jgi:hypothetical protein
MTPILPTPSSHPAPDRQEGKKERKERKKEKKKSKPPLHSPKKVNHPFIAHSLSTLVYHLTH